MNRSGNEPRISRSPGGRLATRPVRRTGDRTKDGGEQRESDGSCLLEVLEKDAIVFIIVGPVLLGVMQTSCFFTWVLSSWNGAG